MEPVGPSDMSMGMDMACNIERTSSIVFYDFLLLLILELGENVSFICAHAQFLTLMTAIVTLTVWKGFRDCVSPPSLLRS